MITLRPPLFCALPEALREARAPALRAVFAVCSAFSPAGCEFWRLAAWRPPLWLRRDVPRPEPPVLRRDVLPLDADRDVLRLEAARDVPRLDPEPEPLPLDAAARRPPELLREVLSPPVLWPPVLWPPVLWLLGLCRLVSSLPDSLVD